MNSIDPAIGAVLAAKQSSVQQQVGIAMLAKSLQASKAQGQAAVELLNSAANLGAASQGRAVGKGAQLDTQG